jgi:acetyltransferase-like isoleucine patch superfamily enzyme
MTAAYFVHPTALVESTTIGHGTRIWAFTHVLKDVVIGEQCNIGDHCFIESGVSIGDYVTIKNNTTIWEGITIEQYAFIGPNVVFTNDDRPRSPRFPLVAERYQTKGWLRKTRIREGASIGANTTVLCGVEIGAYAMIGAATLVTHHVPAYALVYGNPGRVEGYVCQCGETLAFTDEHAACPHCQLTFVRHPQQGICVARHPQREDTL